MDESVTVYRYYGGPKDGNTVQLREQDLPEEHEEGTYEPAPGQSRLIWHARGRP